MKLTISGRQVMAGHGLVFAFDREDKALRIGSVLCDDDSRAWMIVATTRDESKRLWCSLSVIEGRFEYPCDGDQLRVGSVPMGRPQMENKDVKWSILSVRVTLEEREILDEAAKGAGVKLSAWVRQSLLEKARRQK